MKEDGDTLPFFKVLDGLTTAIWVYDVWTNSILWGNRKSWQIWGVNNIDELLKIELHHCPEATINTMVAYIQQYEKEYNTTGKFSSQNSEVWPICPQSMFLLALCFIFPHTLFSIFIYCFFVTMISIISHKPIFLHDFHWFTSNHTHNLSISIFVYSYIYLHKIHFARSTFNFYSSLLKNHFNAPTIRT